MEKTVYGVGDMYTIEHDDKVMSVMCPGTGWQISLPVDMPMAESIADIEKDDDGEAMLQFLLDQMMFACTVVGDEEYLRARKSADDALVYRVNEFRKRFATEKDAAIVASLAAGKEDNA